MIYHRAECLNIPCTSLSFSEKPRLLWESSAQQRWYIGLHLLTLSASQLSVSHSLCLALIPLVFVTRRLYLCHVLYSFISLSLSFLCELDLWQFPSSFPSVCRPALGSSDRGFSKPDKMLNVLDQRCI